MVRGIFFLTGFFLKLPQNMDIKLSGNMKIDILFVVFAIFYGCASKRYMLCMCYLTIQ